QGTTGVSWVWFAFPVTLTAGTTITIKYGTESITYHVTAVADDSGSSIPAGSYQGPDQLISFFTANYTLSRDFDISHINGNMIYFSAKQKNYGFDFQPVLTASIEIGKDHSGVPATMRKNFAIWFELYCQNADHTAYEKIYE